MDVSSGIYLSVTDFFIFSLKKNKNVSFE